MKTLTNFKDINYFLSKVLDYGIAEDSNEIIVNQQIYEAEIEVIKIVFTKGSVLYYYLTEEKEVTYLVALLSKSELKLIEHYLYNNSRSKTLTGKLKTNMMGSHYIQFDDENTKNISLFESFNEFVNQDVKITIREI